MRRIPLTNGGVALVDDDDFDRVVGYRWRRSARGYAICEVRRGKVLWMHRLIMRTPDAMDVDHRDMDGLHNCKVNLRNCTRSQNQANHPKRAGSSRYKGVYWNRQSRKWQAQIHVRGTVRYLGRYESEEEAAKAYDIAALADFGEFARLNFPPTRNLRCDSRHED